MGDAAVHVMEEEEEEHIFRSRFPPVAVPEGVTVPEFVLDGVEAYADKMALVEAEPGGRSYTYGEVVRDTARFARALRSVGIRKGHVVVVALPNLAVYPVVSLGIMSAGAVFSGVNPRALAAEIKKQVEDSEAKLVVANEVAFDKVKDVGVPVIGVGDKQRMPGAISWEELLAAADRTGAAVVPVNAAQQSDLCALPYSSGTTGVYKGVMLSHRNLVSNLCSSMFAVGPDTAGQVVTLGLMPFFHIYGITGICCATLRHKGTVVVMDRFDLRTFLRALVDHRVMFAPLVPPVMLAMVKSPVADEFDLSGLALKSVMTAAAPLAPDLLAAFQRKFPGVQVEEAYGLTEHSCITLTHAGAGGDGDDAEKGGGHVAKRSSVGFILPNLEVKFVDPDTGRSLPANKAGELCVRSQCVMQGYYKKKEETERAVDGKGWLHTGDVGYIDGDGDVFIVDRIKELIKYKGFQVAPAELEAVLLSHPSVEDAAVFGMPDEEAGEVPVACVVRRRGAGEGKEEMMAYVAARVASYKRVRVLHLVDAIPKSVSGKILRRQLRDEFIKRMKPVA